MLLPYGAGPEAQISMALKFCFSYLVYKLYKSKFGSKNLVASVANASNGDSTGNQSTLKKYVRNGLEFSAIYSMVYFAFSKNYLLGFMTPFLASISQSISTVAQNNFSNVFAVIKDQGKVPFLTPGT